MSRFCPIVDVRFTSDEEFSLRVGDERRTGGLYYLGIDPRTPDHKCAPDVGLRKLLAGWIDCLIDRQLPCPVYLPFDFGDETTQWLACERSQNYVDVVFGSAPVEGWAINVSDFRGYSASLSDFTPNEPVFIQTFYLPRLLSDLRRQLRCLDTV